MGNIVVGHGSDQINGFLNGNSINMREKGMIRGGGVLSGNVNVNNNEQNVVMASVDTIDLENFNRSLYNEVNNINKDNFEQEYISPKKIKLFTKNKQLNVENAEHFTFSKKDVKELKRSQSSKGKLKRERSNSNTKENKSENKRSRSRTPVVKKEAL